MKTSKVIQFLLVIGVTAGLSYGCSTARPGEVVPETRYVVVDKAAPIPPGVLRYCWEEPIVRMDPMGPGVDAEGHWYHPSYIAVRVVRDGRWRPCQPAASEIKGETKNER